MAPAPGRAALEATVRSLRSDGREREASRPILLIHGFGVASSVLIPLERELLRALGRPVHRLRLGKRLPLHLQDIRTSASQALEELEHLAAAPGFEYADVVGHSLGGLVATYLLKRLDRGRRIRKVVTLGSPHRGTPAAFLGVVFLGAFSRAVWQMVPGSSLLEELEHAPVPPGSELVAVSATGDAVVPPRFSRVAEHARQLNELVTDVGHWQLILSSPVVGLVGQLLH